MRRLSQGQFPQRRKVLLGEEILNGLLRFLRRINHAAFQTMQQRARCHVHHDHFIGFLHHPVGHGLAHADAGHMPHLVVQALDMLHVQAGEDVDSRVQNQHHILPSLGAFRARHVGMRELVDCGHLRLAHEHGVGIHLFEYRAAVLNNLARNELQAFRLRDGLFAPVRFEIRDHNIAAVFAAEPVRFGQHLICFADAGRVAEEYFELAAMCTHLRPAVHAGTAGHPYPPPL